MGRKNYMKSLKEIDRLKGSQKWSLVLGIGLLCVIGNIFVVQKDGNLFSSLLFFYFPLGLSFVLLGINISVVLTLFTIVFATLILLTITTPSWIFITLISGFLINTFYWYRWGRERELQDFQFQKLKEELVLSLNDNRLAHEKVKIAYQANQIKVQRYTALNELARSLAMTFKTQDVVILLIETISKTFMVQGGVYTLLLFDSSVGKSLHAVRYSVDTEMDVRLNRERLNPAEIFNAWVIAQAKTLFINDASNDFRFQNFSSVNKVKSLVTAPLLAGTEIVGLIRMESCFPSVFKQDDARLLSNFCDLGTVALEHVALYRQTIELAITDGLTGLYVQRYYKERVRDEVFRAFEHRLPLCLMMIDVDNFKSYNDRYGHLVGDRVLKVVAQVLKETVRTVDLVARYGGEEFSVLLLKTPWVGAQTVAERIRQKIAEQEIIASQQATHVTVSIGVAELNPTFKDVEAFIDAADQALYQAKAEGKNCVRRAKMGGTHE